jgi:hypothetical protein
MLGNELKILLRRLDNRILAERVCEIDNPPLFSNKSSMLTISDTSPGQWLSIALGPMYLPYTGVLSL